MKQRVAVLSLVALVGAACFDGDAPAVTITTTSESPGEPTAAAATTTLTPIGDTASTITGALDTGSMIVTGPQEIVFDWSSDPCDDLDIPDLPARTFRDADGTVQLISTHTTARRSTGPSLEQALPFSFETSGRSAFVYFTRNNAGHADLDRDLVRVPVEFAFEGGWPFSIVAEVRPCSMTDHSPAHLGAGS